MAATDGKLPLRSEQRSMRMSPARTPTKRWASLVHPRSVNGGLLTNLEVEC